MPWPDGKRCAVAFTFDVDAELPLLTPDLAFADRMGAMSHQAYGPLVGVPRLLNILDEFDIPATFFVPGYTAHRQPDAIRSTAKAVTRSPTTGTCTSRWPESTRTPNARSSSVAWRRSTRSPVCGRPVPRADVGDELAHPKLLAEYGFIYDSTLMDSEIPASSRSVTPRWSSCR